MTGQLLQAETESQPNGKKIPVPAASAAPAAKKTLNGPVSTTQRNSAPTNLPSMVPTTADAVPSMTTTTGKSKNTKKAAIAMKSGAPSPSKSSPSTATKYIHPIPTKVAPVLPPVPIRHPYAHHHYYAYHQHMAVANANSTDPKKAGLGIKSSNPKPTSVPLYNSAQYNKLGVGGETAATTTRGKQGAGAPGQPQPPPMYPPPPPHLPPHHHAYQAWAAYRYAQQHSQYHGGPPPPPPGPPPPWNADAYAAAHQAYAAAASKTAAAATSKKGKNKKGSSGESGAAATGSAGAPTLPPHHHYPPHSGPPPPPAGPYRYSDTTLRRDALSRVGSSSDNNKHHPNGSAATKGSSPSSSLSGNPPTPVSSTVAKNGVVGGPVMVGANHTPPDPATLHMLELEARAEGATSPSQIEDFHREEVTTMGCTCKKTKCLKLYCQCFAVKIYCGPNCRCLSCSNSQEHENERQDAIRAILSRNPTAFDTKFQKNNRKMLARMAGPSGIIGHSGATGANPAASAGAGGLMHGGLGVMDIPHARTISHKLGCKCRKSACMKKYCECYAGNVKCSANCRCVGCKNMPPGGFGPPPSATNAAVNPNAAANVKITPTKNIMTTPVKKEPSWMMNAAQNLTFLKHGSAEKPKRIISRAPSEAGSMPSLESSSEESPGVGGSKIRTKALTINGARSMPVPSTAERAAVNALQSSEKTAVNALLMAAMAMTEMSGHSYGNTNNEDRQDTSSKNGAPLTSSATSTFPLNNREKNHYNNSSPEATNRAADEHFETPQRNLLKKFMSPKRKVGDRNAEEKVLPSRNLATSDAYSESEQDDDDSPKREHPGDGTPSLLQKVKRSRLGSLKKGDRLLEREKSNGDQRLLEATSTTNGVVPMEMATPSKGTSGVKIADLTPVSARCIDFKKMRVNDSSSDPAVVDSVAL